MPLCFIVEGTELSAKTIANMQEVKARKGPVLALHRNLWKFLKKQQMMFFVFQMHMK